MATRLKCCVDRCNRTTGEYPPDSEWICPLHWQWVPKLKRRAYTRVKRRFRANPSDQNRDAARRIWERMKRLAHRGMMA